MFKLMADSKKIPQEPSQQIPADVDESIVYLKACKDYSIDEASQHVLNLDGTIWSARDPNGIIARHIGASGIGSIFPVMFEAYLTCLDSGEWESPAANTLRDMLCVFTSLTDVSAECGIAVARSGGIPLMFKGLERIKNMETEDLVAKRRIFLILHNAIRLCPGNLTFYRSSNAVTILKKLLNGPDQLEQFFSLMILAYIATDLEKKELATADRGLKKLIETLKEAVANYPQNAPIGTMSFTALEILDAINKHAINDAVKNAIASEDGIPAIVKMLQDDFSSEEQKIAAKTVWNLAFVESIRQSDILQHTIPTLKHLTNSEDKDVRRACVSALFEIQGSVSVDSSTPSANTPSVPPPTYQEAISEPAQLSSTRHVQVMISYQWDSQERAMQIRDSLVAAGYKIWMDVTNMRGDILKAMADAVEKSDVILLCMTEQYKDSQSCRTEASYAFKLQKKIIPLLLQKDYKPDGWLGLVQGMDLYYSFHSDERMNESMGELLKVLGEQNSSDVDEVDGPIRQTSQETQRAIVNATPKQQNTPAAAEWSKEDVQRWLRDNDLAELCDKFRRFGGRHLKLKYDQYCKDDVKFEELMKSEYGMDDAIFTDFIVNLQDAFNE